MPIQVFEAVVVDGAPVDAPPGHITVYIPEVGGTDELPITVAPLYPGWTAGGWHTTPQAVMPETDLESGTSEDAVRVIVIAISEYDYRWIGTSQEWTEIADNSATRCGARSHKGWHKIIMDDDVGVQIVVSESADPDGAKNYLSIGADNAISMSTKDGTVLYMNGSTINLVSSAGDVLAMHPDNGVSLVHNGGGNLLALGDGFAKLMGGDVQIIGGAVTITGQGGIVLTDDITGVTPTQPLVLGTTFLTDLSTFLLGCIADVALSPGVAAAAGVLNAQVMVSLGLGPPYLSTTTGTT